jgi:hypothetical protein
MKRRYHDFAALKNGKTLQALARLEIGGTPSQVPAAYARRSPSHYVRQLAEAGVPLQIYWSIDDRVIADQREEAGRAVRADPRPPAGRAPLGLRGDVGPYGRDAAVASPAPVTRAIRTPALAGRPGASDAA